MPSAPRQRRRPSPSCVQASGFCGSFLLGVLAALAAVACYSIQTDPDPYLFDAPLGECVRDSAHRKKKD